ncbi:MAG: hypothetical protein KR126chlam3_00297 [Chlamydiae bacterium]|nr:hypothetical protein [Chlamydiota bacterium]
MRYALLILLFLFSSCARRAEDPVITQMRTRGMQTRSFVGHDAKTVTKEIIGVLQDQGYMVKNVSGDVGLLTAEKDTNIEKFASKFWSSLVSGRQARWKKHSVIELTTNITEETGKTKVRINYLIRIFDNLGRIVDVHQVLEEEVYTDFFNKIQKGLLAKQS